MGADDIIFSSGTRSTCA